MATKIPRSKENDYTRRDGATAPGVRRASRPARRSSTSASYSFDPACCRATSRTSSAWRRCRSASPVRCASTASTPRASSTSRWRRPRARSSPATTAACGCSARAAACAPPCVERVDAALAGLHLRRRAARRASSASGSREHFDEITARRRVDDQRPASCIDIGQYAIGPLRYLRFNYTTGDAAGQNMTGKATLRRLRVDPGAAIRAAPSTSCRATSTPTRSTRTINMLADARPARRRRGGRSRRIC